MTASGGFHDGELAVQERAGVRGQAARLSGLLARTVLSGGASRFLEERTLAVNTAHDSTGRLWTSPLVGPPGFLAARSTNLHIRAVPAAEDPLAGLPAGQSVGMLAIDFDTRRRMRVNGNLVVSDADGLQVDVEQAFGNCPKYIHPRHLESRPPDGAAPPSQRGTSLSLEAIRTIQRSDTFFLGTHHPTHGTDSSHRGGTPGFVRVEGTDVWWPDYPGNNMFNSMGNLAVDSTAALLFVDFTTGATLHLSGTAALEWPAPGSAGDDAKTGRRVRFTVRHAITGRTFPLRARHT
jgi:predicted pyridoxine 5'-phosphate oxidase superfamily flavin-nucleotide-binding protein